MFKKKDYSFLSKILHHLALGSNFIPEMLHDIEFGFFKKKLEKNNLKQHVFICGLARSGTTILMRLLYETQEFASLTYRDMPFVVLPNLWSRISNKIKPKQARERIHNDNIKINIDSPEALEEIFWRVKLQKKYIYSNKLIPHMSDDFTIEEFKNFIYLILHKYKKKLYLSKNNNNLLRVESLIRAFPNCIILIPFRNPFEQANSLLNQHQRFIQIQKEDKFVKKYMSYLAHHEFGLDHRPYKFNENEQLKGDKDSINYWLNQWINVYKYLSQEKFFQKNNMIYINYEYLCKNPKTVLRCIERKTNLKNLAFNTDELKFSFKKVEITDNEFKSEANRIFEKLKKLNDKIFL